MLVAGLSLVVGRFVTEAFSLVLAGGAVWACEVPCGMVLGWLVWPRQVAGGGEGQFLGVKLVLGTAELFRVARYYESV